MSQNRSNESSRDNPAHLFIPELDVPLSFIDRLLLHPNGQHVSLSRDDFLLTMIDNLINYVLQTVSAEVNNQNRQLNPQDAGRAAGRNRAPQRYFPGAALFDKMPGSKRKG